MKIISIVFIIMITGCQSSKHESRVTCSSGFTTGWNRYTLTGNGVVEWYGNYYEDYHVYRMTPGETCTKERRMK